MPPATPSQQRTVGRFETLIGLIAPMLDVVLVVGERVSRIAAREDDYIPIRGPGEAFDLSSPRPRGLPPAGD